MSYCLNSSCQSPTQNSTVDQFCKACGTRLLLQDRYRALKPLGQGGFGVTYLAVDQAKPSKPACVIKQFNPQGQGNLAKAVELFQQEAVRLEQLGHHEQIPTLYAHCEQDGGQYIVQEYIQGQNLGEELEQRGAFNQQQVRQVLLDLLPVLQFIHQGQVIHRDIKPENIIRNPEGNLVLVDFGAAKYATGTALVKTGTVIGSAEYTAPEQAGGKATFASDLYGLGVTCLVLLTQQSPFDLYSFGEMAWVWRQYLHGQTVSDELGKVLDKLVAQGLNYRYQTAAQVLQDLLPPVSKPVASPSPAPPPAQPAETGTIARLKNTLFGGLKTPTPLPQPASRQPSGLQRVRFKVITVNDRGQQISRKPGQAEYFVESWQGFRLEMVAIPGGTFQMGSDESDHEKPIHAVRIQPLFMGKYPVTQSQWQAVARLPKVKRDLNPDPADFKEQNRPVEQVNWDDAVEFCQRLSRKTGKDYRLPSEAEWEYACRAGTTTPFHFGETLTTDLANYNGNYTYGNGPKGKYLEQTADVGSYPPNGFGLYEMHGNVWEWCADYYHQNYNGAPTDGTAWITRGDSSCRVVRGGSWGYDPQVCRSATRYRDNPDDRHSVIGFRVVAVLV